MMDIVVVGSCMTDLISYVPRLPKLGETLHGHTFKIGFGGKGANQCVVAGRLGAKTAMVARLGDDTFGHNYMQNFKDNSIVTDHVRITKGQSTGVATITVDEQGHNAIVIVSGANSLLNQEDITGAEALIKNAKVMIGQLEIPPETTLAAIKLAKKYGVATILNPAPATANLNEALYTTCDIFCPNETEAELLTGKTICTIDEAKNGVKILLEKGCNKVVITMGENGCVYGSNFENIIHIPLPTKQIKCVDSTGAGDAFVGALAYYMSSEATSKMHIEEMLKRSCEIATMSVQHEGTQSSYPWRKDLPEHLLQ